jgi:hypothetical protein
MKSSERRGFAPGAGPGFNRRMRIRVGVLLGLGLALWAATAAGDTFYKYRNKRTGRDVFVNRLEQVPRQYRGQAKVVLEATSTVTATDSQTETEVVEVVQEPAPAVQPTPLPAAPAQIDLRRALRGRGLGDLPLVVGALIDAKLAAKGAPPLTPSEHANLASLIWTILTASLLAALAALAAWIVVLVTAVRDGRTGWAIFMFLFSPLAYVYVFVYGGKGRGWWKALVSLGMLSPALVGLVGSWRFYAWFAVVIEARGGHL